MKPLLLFVSILLGACSAPHSYTLQGEIEGLEGTICLINLDTFAQDSARIENGRFTFNGTTEKPTLAVIVTPSKDFSTNLFLESGTIKVSGRKYDRPNITLQGTPTNEAFALFKKRQWEIDKFPPEEQHAAFINLEKETVAANRDNMLGVTLLSLDLVHTLPASEILAEIALFTPEMQQTKQLADLKASSQVRRHSEIGQPYLNIIQPDTAGKPVSLKSIVENPKNKYVLLDFWASWCKPCMGEVPYLLADYAKYRDKGFEIYAVSFDADRAAWLSTLREQGMQWVQVSELKRFDNQAARDYGIKSIPSNLLIETATGKIAAANLRGDALGKKLAALLGE